MATFLACALLTALMHGGRLPAGFGAAFWLTLLVIGFGSLGPVPYSIMLSPRSFRRGGWERLRAF